MLYNPITGQYEEYQAPTAVAGVGMNALDVAGVEAPFIFRMLEQSPGFITSMGYSTYRGSNTLLRGGSKSSLFKTTPLPSDFFNPVRGAEKIAKGSSPFLKRSLQQNFPRPRNIRQFTDLSIFADPNRNMYSPFGFASMFGHSEGVLGSGTVGRKLGEKMFGESMPAYRDYSSFGGGLISFISAGTRIDRLERRAARGSQRAAAKLAQVDANIDQLRMLRNNPFLDVDPAGIPTGAPPGMFMSGDDIMAQRQTGYGASAVGRRGVRSAMLANLAPGQFTQKMLGYKQVTMGLGTDDLVGAARVGGEAAERRFNQAFIKAFGDTGGLTTRSGAFFAADEAGAQAFLRSTSTKGMFRQLGAKGSAKMASAGAARMMALKAGALAVPGLQVVAAVMLAYDVGQMMGEGVKAAINLSKDAMVSLRGSINKPAFGMGYRDTEIAATSRARGVMAIQNSRLNMRSLLGSEAGMMAAHYG